MVRTLEPRISRITLDAYSNASRRNTHPAPTSTDDPLPVVDYLLQTCHSRTRDSNPELAMRPDEQHTRPTHQRDHNEAE